LYDYPQTRPRRQRSQAVRRNSKAPLRRCGALPSRMVFVPWGGYASSTHQVRQAFPRTKKARPRGRGVMGGLSGLSRPAGRRRGPGRVKWAPTGKPTAPSGDPVFVSQCGLGPAAQRGLFFGESGSVQTANAAAQYAVPAVPFRRFHRLSRDSSKGTRDDERECPSLPGCRSPSASGATTSRRSRRAP
jgi:hypothetical protein